MVTVGAKRAVRQVAWLALGVLALAVVLSAGIVWANWMFGG